MVGNGRKAASPTCGVLGKVTVIADIVTAKVSFITEQVGNGI
jgi:hypothetical protein